MTKKEITDRYAFMAGLSKSQAAHDFELLMDIVTDALICGEDITLKGFGTFKVTTRKARKTRNIHTGETIDVPAQKTVKFIVSPEIKMALNK